MSSTFMKEANNAYQAINNRWQKFHYQVLVACVLISMVFEVIMYFIIRFTGTIYDTVMVYWLKYIIIPALIGLVLIVIARYVIRNRRLRQKVKTYALSLLLTLVALNLSFMHSGYISILYVASIPILMTIMYEDQTLTRMVYLMSLVLQVFSALSDLWDPYKVLDHQCMINLIIIVITTSVIYFVSVMMIRFAIMKRQTIVERDVERQQLKVQIQLDDLTKVGNKHALLQQIDALKNREETYFVAMMDIDDFKLINDQRGHLFGDEVLKCLGTCLKQMKQTCLPYRYGGDEFCVIFLVEEEQEVRRMVKQLQHEFVVGCRNLQNFEVTISAGIAKHESGMDVVELLQGADRALYEAKNIRKQKSELI